ncbi:FAD-dependent monooxygenase [Nonomuraea sp. H19]|uniref:FAD-dependent monooxygenase n=1 Tax=Nonomuraea sp. H19 TaxID=3452206 RepID=UPI003F8A4EFF
MNQHQPVLVLGNGPVGQTAALLLARWGIPVVVLDGRPARDLVGSKAICQQRDVLDIWESVGVGATLAAEGVTWTRARTFYRDDELFTIDFEDPGASPFPPFVNISQCRTEEVLDDQIEAQPLIEVRWGQRVIAIAQDAEGVTVACETEAGETEVRGSYLLACPGARGDAIREMLGLSFEGHTFGDQFLICDLRTDLPGWERERRFYFDPQWNPGRQVLIHPCPDSTFRIDWQVPENFELAEEERTGALDARIRRIIGDCDYEIVWKSAYRFHSRVVNRMRVGRALLAGDGAHLVAPFGARGLNSGVQDAENAAWKLAYVLNGWAPESLLDTYHHERHAAALENLEVTGATMRFLVPQTEEQWEDRRRTLEAARHDTDSRARVDSGRLAEPFWYVDSPLTTPDPRGPFAGRPAKGTMPTPAPGVLMPDFPVRGADGGETHLRRLLRDGITVLVGAACSPSVLSQAREGSVGPVQAYAFADLSPALAGVMGAEAAEIWVVRPDAHVAAVLRDPSPAELTRALDRVLARGLPATV